VTHANRQSVVKVEQVGPLRSAGWFAIGWARGKWWMVTLLIGLGIFFGSHGSSEHAPVRAQREKIESRQQERLLQGSEEEERQVENAQPGGPQPARSFLTEDTYTE
jgi:hypothetical protein